MCLNFIRTNKGGENYRVSAAYGEWVGVQLYFALLGLPRTHQAKGEENQL